MLVPGLDQQVRNIPALEVLTVYWGGGQTGSFVHSVSLFFSILEEKKWTRFFSNVLCARPSICGQSFLFVCFFKSVATLLPPWIYRWGKWSVWRLNPSHKVILSADCNSTMLKFGKPVFLEAVVVCLLAGGWLGELPLFLLFKTAVHFWISCIMKDEKWLILLASCPEIFLTFCTCFLLVNATFTLTSLAHFRKGRAA
jgi:hypothetical protein